MYAKNNDFELFVSDLSMKIIGLVSTNCYIRLPGYAC